MTTYPIHTNQHIDVPLVFFFTAFIIILLGLFSKLSSQKGVEIHTNGKQVAVTFPTKDATTKLKSLNYNSPIGCDVVNSGATISAQLTGTSVSVKIQEKTEVKKVIVEGDCMYSWIETEKKGLKQCGMGQYITIGKQLLGSGLASADSLNSIIKQMGKNLPIDIGTLLQSCNNVKEVNKQSFVIPKGIVFE